MLGRIGAAEAADDPVHDLVHRIPAVEKGLSVGAQRLGDVEVNIAVAEMAEGDHARPGREGLDRGRRLPDQRRHEPDLDRDVMFDRTALLDLRLGNRFAQTPKLGPLLERRSDRRILDDPVLERRLQRLGKRLVQPARAFATPPP